MAKVTSALVFRVKEGHTEQHAREEVAGLRNSVKAQGGESYLNALSMGGPPGSFVLYLQWPDEEAYATAVSGEEALQTRIAATLGQSDLDITDSYMLWEVQPE